jgi:hypothetical protein
VEGLLTEVRDSLRRTRFTTLGDSAVARVKSEWEDFYARLETCISGERPFTLVAPTAVSTLRPSVVRLDAEGGDLALQGVQLKPLQVQGGAGEDAVRLSSSVEGTQSAYGFGGADVLSAPKGGRLVGGGDAGAVRARVLRLLLAEHPAQVKQRCAMRGE